MRRVIWCSVARLSSRDPNMSAAERSLAAAQEIGALAAGELMVGAGGEPAPQVSVGAVAVAGSPPMCFDGPHQVRRTHLICDCTALKAAHGCSWPGAHSVTTIFAVQRPLQLPTLYSLPPRVPQLRSALRLPPPAGRSLPVGIPPPAGRARTHPFPSCLLLHTTGRRCCSLCCWPALPLVCAAGFYLHLR
ncbi:hypothetical protein B0H10DRAFT_1415299 [Mycena sp. CBHHK59/15]|nr:hypothetical protein B0H10DRAFT_1415299 [Mycena sp. CBHHK59/15]